MACKQNLTQVTAINQEGGQGNSTKKTGHEGRHGLEQRTALNLEKKVTNNHTEGPGQTGRNRSIITNDLKLCKKWKSIEYEEKSK